MTKEDFYLRTIISMAGNSNYVKVSTIPPDEEFDEETDSRILNKEELLEDAIDLLKETERTWPGVFDEDDVPDCTTKKLLYDLCSAVEDISCPDGKIDRLNDLMLDIRNSLDALNETFAKLVAEPDEEE